jgi:2-polyprenyl-3-methyl-5-hydroxy-6-metoxy-1,4-benzoquinol methylase
MNSVGDSFSRVELIVAEAAIERPSVRQGVDRGHQIGIPHEDGVINGVVNSLFRQSMRTRFLKALEGCSPVAGKTVLDIGCGPGHYSVALARMGASRVLGVDVAEGTLDIARARAEKEGVSHLCEFSKKDFFTEEFAESFDYVIVTGFMDYVEDAPAAVRKMVSLTRGKAFFSFPIAGGLLAWQRQLRYRSRCPLYLYTHQQVRDAFRGVDFELRIEKISRDFFVTAARQG